MSSRDSIKETCRTAKEEKDQLSSSRYSGALHDIDEETWGSMMEQNLKEPVIGLCFKL